MTTHRPLYQCPLKLAILDAMLDEVEHTIPDLESETNGTAQTIRRTLIEMRRCGYATPCRPKQGRMQGWKITVAGKVALMVAGIPQLA